MANDNKTVVVKGAELWWAKLNADKPVSPFGTPIWELQLRTRDKAEMKKWKDEGLNVKTEDDDEGIYYRAQVKRKAIFEKTGEKMQPVVVVDAKLMPLEADTLGNGSVGNVQLRTRPYEVGGRKGISVELKAVQVTKLVERSGGGGNGLAFEALDVDTEVSEAPASSDASSEDLWD